jgi:1-acyl-sn-glycerol-3-phosphate acyltransferase
MWYVIVSVFVWTVFTLSSFIFFPSIIIIRLLSWPYDPKLRIIHFITSVWGSVFTWANPLLKISIEGREKIVPGKTYVMICNHQSILDILVLYRLFIYYKWVSKAEMFKVPLVGWNMSLNRYIAVNRGNKGSHLKMIKECEKNLQDGNSIMIFPEGTRSEDGKIHAFKDGAFRIAQAAHVDILPILIDGTAEALPKKTVIMRKRQTLRIKVLDPIPYSSFAATGSREVAENIRNLMIDNFPKK